MRSPRLHWNSIGPNNFLILRDALRSNVAGEASFDRNSVSCGGVYQWLLLRLRLGDLDGVTVLAVLRGSILSTDM